MGLIPYQYRQLRPVLHIRLLHPIPLSRHLNSRLAEPLTALNIALFIGEGSQRRPMQYLSGGWVLPGGFFPG